MKNLIFLFAFVSTCTFAQVSGEIATDQRKIVSNIEYTIAGNQNGKFVFDIAVNKQGVVTSCVVIKAESTLVSTPLMMKSKNMIISGLKFEIGPGFPEFHQGKVTITIVKS